MPSNKKRPKTNWGAERKRIAKNFGMRQRGVKIILDAFFFFGIYR